METAERIELFLAQRLQSTYPYAVLNKEAHVFRSRTLDYEKCHYDRRKGCQFSSTDDHH